MSPLQREEPLTCNTSMKTCLCLRVIAVEPGPPPAGPADARLMQVGGEICSGVEVHSGSSEEGPHVTGTTGTKHPAAPHDPELFMLQNSS